ncbi:phosphoenolpyruvate synthase, partial [Candidatus Woesearchaeota archaeon]|nr:phosphoenolpyruvate synthase [Candidatus Woesearchaeota archaeon]
TAEDLPNASFAGQQSTYLNTKGQDELIKAVQGCWASLFNARAIFYRIKNNFPHEKVLIAVIVQKQIDSDASGVMFTLNPSTNNKDEIVIESAFGLGEAIVSGMINPDFYLVDRKSMEIKEKQMKVQGSYIIRDPLTGKTIKKKLPSNLENKQVLSDNEIKKLAEYGIKIEKHYKFPQDIEFAVENKKIFIVQTRPVTAIKKEEEIGKIEKELLLKGLAASSGIATGPVKILKDSSELYKISKGDILVTYMTNPDFVPAMQKASAIITDSGGITSHASIVSRELGIPCIVGTIDATKKLKEDQIVTVNGSEGKVYAGAILFEEKEKPIETETVSEDNSTITQVKVNCDMPASAERASLTNADGIGLIRVEFMIAEKGKHPNYYLQNRLSEYTKLLKDGILEIAKSFKNKPIWVRTSDIRTDEYNNLEGSDNINESNPMLGWHGIRRSVDQPELLKAEFEAIKQIHDEGYNNIGVMLPMVISVDEIRKAKDILREVGLEPQENIDFGVMIECPAAVQIIKELCEEGIDFISFGTNDLTQFTLAIDRNNSKVQSLYNEMHPAVLRQIKHVIDVCKKYDVETSICGQAASNEEMAEFLVKAGIESISANIDSVKKIRKIVAKTEKKLLLGVARKGFKI